MMNVYKYKAVTSSGQSVSGQVNALTEPQASAALIGQGLYPYQISLSRKNSSADKNITKAKWLRAGIRIEEFTRALATLVEAKIPLNEALSMLVDSADTNADKKWIQILANQVNEGAALSRALEEAGAKLPTFFVPMVRAGEQSGRLSDVLQNLAATLRRSRQTKNTIKSALIYPAILIALSIGVIAIFIGVLFPSLQPIFEGTNAELPMPMRISFKITEIIQTQWIVILAILFVLVLAIDRVLKRSVVRFWLSEKILRLPLFGNLISSINVSRTILIVHTQIANGVPLPAAIETASLASNNQVFSQELHRVSQKIREGSSFAEAIQDFNHISTFTKRLIAIGETTGRLPQMLQHIFKTLDVENKRTIENLLTLMTPIITLVIGGLVGLMIYSVMTAILSINDIAIQ